MTRVMKTWPRAAVGLLSTWFATAPVLAGLLVLSCLQVTRAQPIREKMTWVAASDPNALCNDFTQAGFFIRRNSNSNNWVVFLESGGLCYSTDSCNRRFFARSVSQLVVNFESNRFNSNRLSYRSDSAKRRP